MSQWLCVCSLTVGAGRADSFQYIPQARDMVNGTQDCHKCGDAGITMSPVQSLQVGDV